MRNDPRGALWGLLLLFATAVGCASTPPAAANDGTTPLSAADEARYKAEGDWCPEHGVPESQCVKCHPELAEAAPEPPPGADVARLAEHGEDVAALEPHLVAGKVTVFDFYADWCGPCRKIDAHVFQLLGARDDLAYRKLNVVSWDTPLAKHYLGKVSGLPYTIVYGRKGKLVRAIAGFHLEALDAAIAEGARQ